MPLHWGLWLLLSLASSKHTRAYPTYQVVEVDGVHFWVQGLWQGS
jgi:hypothetical protein